MAGITQVERASTVQIVNPGCGYMKWQGAASNTANIGENAQPQVEPSLDSYDRIGWNVVQPSSANTYSWTTLDSYRSKATTQGRRYGSRLRCLGTGTTDYLPTYLRVAPYSAVLTTGTRTGLRVPDWNNETVLQAMEACIAAYGARYDGFFGFVDLGFYGLFGEWHTSGINYGTDTALKTGSTWWTAATTATKVRIIDAYIAAFPNTQLLALPADTYSINYAWDQDYRVTYPIGLRVDSLGHTDWANAIHDLARHDQTTLDRIAARWQVAPMVAEYWGDKGTNSDIFSLANTQLISDHVLMIGNGNFGTWSTFDATNQALALTNGRACGYRYFLETPAVPDTIEQGVPFSLSLSWQNRNLTPHYEPADTYIQLCTPGTATVVWEYKHATVLRNILPTSGTPVVVPDATGTAPSTVPIGAYDVYVQIRDPRALRRPLQLANTLPTGVGVTSANAKHKIGTTTVAVAAVSHTRSSASGRTAATGRSAASGRTAATGRTIV